MCPKTKKQDKILFEFLVLVNINIAKIWRLSTLPLEFQHVCRNLLSEGNYNPLISLIAWNHAPSNKP